MQCNHLQGARDEQQGLLQGTVRSLTIKQIAEVTFLGASQYSPTLLSVFSMQAMVVQISDSLDI